MIDFNKIIEYCRHLSEIILKDKKGTGTFEGDILNKEDQEEILSDLNDKSYWADREQALSGINVDKEWKSLENRIIIPEKKKQYYWKYAAAAVLIIGFGVGVFYNSSMFDRLSPEATSSRELIVAGSDKAILTLENGEEVELADETSYNTDDANLVNSELLYTKELAPTKKPANGMSYNILTIPRGGKFLVQLSDGTRVWLNSDSQLKYPVYFIQGQPREVELVYGEAYFDVSHSTDNGGDSFVVKQERQKIEVLGTEFNISAYKDDEHIYTTLIKGSVAINNDQSTEILKPGEQAVNQNKTSNIKISKVEVAYATAWKDGFFMFQDETLSSMMQQLSRWYDVKVEFVNTEKQNYTFAGTLKRTDHIEKLLKSLEQTGEVTFEIKDKTIMIK